MMTMIMTDEDRTHSVVDGRFRHAVGNLHLRYPLGHVPLVVMFQLRGLAGDGDGRLDVRR